jgi:diadenosine tetraphosphatase ApaH/serine/threonine PP2A family protein phosphatase
VLRDIDRRGGVDRIWCLGDIVGYGPDPHECIEALRETAHISTAGNHDLAAIGRVSADEFNPDAAEACRWTTKRLTAADADYLGSLPLAVTQDDFTLVHGSPRDPVWEYILHVSQARDNFDAFNTGVCIVGHSHVPLVFAMERSNGPSRAERETTARQFTDELMLTASTGGARMIVNPGAVGQPRDGDPRAAYAIYDSENGVITPCRVEYDVAATQARMGAAGLPMGLISRLSYGM